jgi:hypothetical protein
MRPYYPLLVLAFRHAIPGGSLHLRLLYTPPASDEIDYELVRDFRSPCGLHAEAANLFSESPTFNAKETGDKSNLAEAIAALSNTDDGEVILTASGIDTRSVPWDKPQMQHQYMFRAPAGRPAFCQRWQSGFANVDKASGVEFSAS